MEAFYKGLFAAFVTAVFLLVAWASIIQTKTDDETTQDVANRRLHLVTVEGTRCMVLTQAGGKIIQLNCDWSDK